MELNKEIILGFLTVILLSSGLIVVLPGEVKLEISNENTQVFVMQGDNWTLGGTEYNRLYDGRSKIDQGDTSVSNDFISEFTLNSERTAQYEDATIIDTYVFNGSVFDKSDIPLSHEIKILNAKGKIYAYEVNDLYYVGESMDITGTSMRFGNNMKVVWDEGYYSAKIYKYKNKDVGKLVIKYRVDSDEFILHNRLFDPPIAVGTCQELADARNDVAGEYYLTTDIDCAGFGNWETLGNVTNPFTGSLDGDDGAGGRYTISNIEGTYTADFAGVFGQASAFFSVTNVNFDNITTNTITDYNGIVIGTSNSGDFTYENITVSNSRINGSFTTSSYCGGVMGSSNSAGTWKNLKTENSVFRCYSDTGSITGYAVNNDYVNLNSSNNAVNCSIDCGLMFGETAATSSVNDSEINGGTLREGTQRNGGFSGRGGADIRDITIRNVDVYGGTRVGIITGDSLINSDFTRVSVYDSIVSGSSSYVGCGVGTWGGGTIYQDILFDNCTGTGVASYTGIALGYITAAGTFDNITVKNSNWTSSSSYVGAFTSYTAVGPTASNIYIENTYLQGTDYTAGAVGYHINGDITNVTMINVDVKATAGSYSGIAIGRLGNANMDMLSINGGSVNGISNVGGGIGYQTAGTMSNFYLDDATVTGTGSYVACIVSTALGGTITNGYGNCDVNGVNYAGGIAGLTGAYTMNNVFFAGNISGATNYGGTIAYCNGATNYNNITYNNHTGNPDQCGSIQANGCSFTCEAIQDNEPWFYDERNAPQDNWDYVDYWGFPNGKPDVAFPCLLYESGCYAPDRTFPQIEFVDPTTAAGTYEGTNSIQGNVTCVETTTFNLTMNLYKDGALYQTNSTASSPLYVLYDGLTTADYLLNASCSDVAGNTNSTETRSINLTYDNTAPYINYTTISSGVDFITAGCLAWDEVGPITYELIINGTGESSGNISTCSHTFTNLEPSTTYEVTYYARDSVDNENSTTNSTMTKYTGQKDWTPQGNPNGRWSMQLKDWWKLFVKKIFWISDDGETQVNAYISGDDLMFVNNNSGNYVFDNNVTADTFKGDLEGDYANLNYISFNTTWSNGHVEGTMHWDEDDGTLEVDMPGGIVSLQVGLENLMRATNNEGSEIGNCQAVYISGATGNFPDVKLAGIEKGYRIAQAVSGIATESISDSQKGFINTFGLVRDCDTSDFSDGDSLFLGVGGNFTNVPPAAPNATIFMGVVLRSHETEGVILNLIDKLPILTDLSDVRNGQINNSILAWDNDSSVWKSTNDPIFNSVTITDGNRMLLSNLSKSAEIDGSVFGISMTNPPNQEVPHFWVQSGGSSQASGVARSFMIVDEAIEILNNTNRTSCSSWATHFNKTLRIDCNTTTTGADLLIGDDMQIFGTVYTEEYTPSAYSIIAGSLDSGDIDDLVDMFGNLLVINEPSGGTGFEVRFNFTGLEPETPKNIIARWAYNGGAGHKATWDIYNGSDWNSIRSFSDDEGYGNSMTMILPNNLVGDYVTNGIMQVRVKHQDSGINSHDLFLDYVGVKY